MFDIYSVLLKLSSDEFKKLINDEKIECFISQRVIKRLSSKHIVAYKNSIEKISLEEKKSYELQEWYFRARLIIDYISGMTDDFAYDEYKVLSALK